MIGEKGEVIIFVNTYFWVRQKVTSYSSPKSIDTRLVKRGEHCSIVASVHRSVVTLFIDRSIVFGDQIRHYFLANRVLLKNSQARDRITARGRSWPRRRLDRCSNARCSQFRNFKYLQTPIRPKDFSPDAEETLPSSTATLTQKEKPVYIVHNYCTFAKKNTRYSCRRSGANIERA